MGEDASRFEEKIKQFKDNWSKDDPLWIWFRKVSRRGKGKRGGVGRREGEGEARRKKRGKRRKGQKAKGAG